MSGCRKYTITQWTRILASSVSTRSAPTPSAGAYRIRTGRGGSVVIVQSNRRTLASVGTHDAENDEDGLVTAADAPR